MGYTLAKGVELVRFMIDLCQAKVVLRSLADVFSDQVGYALCLECNFFVNFYFLNQWPI